MRQMFTIPNILGFSRLFSAPVVFFFIWQGDYTIAFWWFVVAGLTDAIDGPIARKLNQTNRFGLFLDPIADKFLVNAAYISLSVVGLLPVWIAALVFARDFLIALNFTFSTLLGHQVVVDPVRLGRTNTGLQILLVALALGGAAYQLPLDEVIRLLAIVVALTTTLSGLIYFRRWLESFSKSGA